MRRLSAVAALAVLAALPAAAQVPADAARAQAELMAMAIDTDHNQMISNVEMQAYGWVVFDTLDNDGNRRLTRDEIAAFRFGMTEIAEFRGRQQAYDTAQAIVFDIFDRDDDGEITDDEHENAFARAYGFADLDGDGMLSMGEYRRGFIYNIAMRAALSG